MTAGDRRRGESSPAGTVLVAAGLAAAGSAAPAEPAPWRDDRRIVSLLPSITETVCALGACDRLVATDRFSNWRARAASLPKLGGVEDPQIERHVALKPDVVLASTSARLTDRLESLGIKVFSLESKSEADVRRTLPLLGQMLGVERQAEEEWTRIEHQVRAAAARVPAALRGKRVYFEIDATPDGAGPGPAVVRVTAPGRIAALTVADDQGVAFRRRHRCLSIARRFE